MKPDETKYYYAGGQDYIKIIGNSIFWYNGHKGEWKSFVSNADDVIKYHPFAIEVTAEQVFIDIL